MAKEDKGEMAYTKFPLAPFVVNILYYANDQLKLKRPLSVVVSTKKRHLGWM